MKVNCTCKHAFQDELYGVGVRIANPMKNPTQARCTVCSKVHTVKYSEKSTK